MKRTRILTAVLAVLLILAQAAAVFAQDAEVKPGLQRAAGGVGYDTAANVASAYNIKLKSGAPLYKPTNGQPLNAYIVTHKDCQVGISNDDIYKVSEKGLVTDITSVLKLWAQEIEEESGNTIRFVSEPNDADILIVVNQSFKYKGKYKEEGSSNKAKVYSCTVKLTAYRLSNTKSKASMSLTSNPGRRVTAAHGSSVIWMTSPSLKGSKKLTSFVESILKWYGYGAKKGASSKIVKPVQTALIQRGYLTGKADGKLGTKSVDALKRLQANYGLEQTGKVDRETLLALYYDQDSVKGTGN